MDITKDLKRVMTKNASANEIVDDICNLQDELRLKAHIFKVLSLANKIDESINENALKNTNIKLISLEFLHEIDDDDRRGFIVNYSFHDVNNNLIPRFKISDLNASFTKAFLEIKNVDINLTNKKELEKFHMLEVNETLSDKLLDLFLDKNLKTIFEYNKMQLSLEDSNSNKSKKTKKSKL